MKREPASSTAETDLRRVLKHYDLGSLLTWHQAESGHVNENWFVTTTSGRYFLKRRHPGLRHPDAIYHPDIIRPQHELVIRLRQAGFPAPALVPAAGGETLLVLESECIELQEFIEGHPYDHGRPPHLDEAAATLARYHKLVSSLVREPLCDRGVLYAPARVQEHLSRLDEAWRLGEEPDLIPLVQRLADHAVDLQGGFAGHGELPHLVIHGDYYGGNLLFAGDRIAGVVDYDRARWNPRVVELAEALIYFSSARQGPLKHLVYPGVLCWDTFTRFLRGYGRVLSLPEGGELAALPDTIRCIWLQMAPQRQEEAFPRLPADPRATLQELLVLGDWARDNGPLMVETVQSVAESALG